MRRPYVPMLAFALLLLLLHLPLSSDFVSSVIPGWHTSVRSPLMKMDIVLSCILLAVIFVYWKLPKWRGHIPGTVFLSHFLLSLPLILFTSFSELLLLFIQQRNSSSTPEEISLTIHYSLLTASLLFLAGQVLFITFTCKALLRAHRS